MQKVKKSYSGSYEQVYAKNESIITKHRKQLH